MKLIRIFRACIVGPLLLTISTTSCSDDKRSNSNVISWTGNSGLESISLSLGGEFLGKGEEGLNVLLARLTALDDKLMFIVRFPVKEWQTTGSGYRDGDVLPFGEHDDARRRFEQIMTQKRFTFVFRGIDADNP